MEKVLFEFSVNEHQFQIIKIESKDELDRGKLVLASPLLLERFNLDMVGPGSLYNGRGEVHTDLSFNLKVSLTNIAIVQIVDHSYGHTYVESLSDNINEFDTTSYIYFMVIIFALQDNTTCNIRKLNSEEFAALGI